MSLTDNSGLGLMAIGEPYISTSAYMFPTEDLDEPGTRKSQRHISDIQMKDMVTWNIDLKQMGVGGDTSWGAYLISSILYLQKECSSGSDSVL